MLAAGAYTGGQAARGTQTSPVPNWNERAVLARRLLSGASVLVETGGSLQPHREMVCRDVHALVQVKAMGAEPLYATVQVELLAAGLTGFGY